MYLMGLPKDQSFVRFRGARISAGFQSLGKLAGCDAWGAG